MTSATLTPENAAQVFKNYGGVAIEPVKPLDSGLIVGLFAPGGTGKTTLAASITDSPLGSPALHLDARGNPHVISSYGERVRVAHIDKFSTIEKIRLDLVADKNCPYKTLIYDTVTEMHAMDLRDRYGPMGDVTWDKHSATTKDILQMVRNAVDLALGPLKMNIVFVFQEVQELRTIRGEKDVRRTEISLSTALQAQIPGIITFLGRLYIDSDTKPFVRKLDFTPAEKVQQAKYQVDPNDPIASTIPMEIWHPSLAPILDAMRGGVPFPAAKHKKSST